MSKQKILYVGYQIVDNELASKLEPYISDKISRLRNDIYTVKHYRDDQNTMQMWYNKNKDKIITGYIKSIYIHETKNILTIVAIVNIESDIFYITLVNDSNIPLITVKTMTNRGDFGKPIELVDKIPVTMRKCIQYC